MSTEGGVLDGQETVEEQEPEPTGARVRGAPRGLAATAVKEFVQ